MGDSSLLSSLLHEDLGVGENASDSQYRFTDTGRRGAFIGSLAASFLKKLEPVGINVQADANALDLFLKCNDSLPADSYEFEADDEASSLFWDYFRSNLNKTLGDVVGSEEFKGEVPPEDLRARPRRERPDPSETGNFQSIDLDFVRAHLSIGPGSSIRADSRHMVTKLFESPFSHYDNNVSSYLIALYRAALVETDLWCDAERLRNRKFGYTKVRGATIFFAKKNADISRVCATEALIESIFQRVCGAFAELRLEACFGINLSTQPIFNRQMAKLGSVDGSIGTIDLKSASDMQGLHMINRALDHCSFKTMINLCRSEFVVLPDGKLVKLNMMSTMGNGFTFPLQTIVFACAVRAVYAMMGLPSFCNRTQFGVFGDDICVHASAYTFLCRMLTKLGFVVNNEKSFNSGPFRESCGGDYYQGFDIRGVYVKKLQTSQQIVSIVNRLNRWSARSGVELPLTVSYLLALVDHPIHKVPISEDDEAGIHVPFLCTFPKVTNAYWFHYRKWRARTPKMELPEPDDAVNPSGIGVGILAGAIRRRDSEYGEFWKANSIPGFWVSKRDPTTENMRYKTVGTAIPYWDYCPPRVGLSADEYKQWSRLVLAQQ